MPDLPTESPRKNPEESSDKWSRLEAMGEGPNPLSDENWRFQVLQFFLGLLALFAVFLCIWNGILGFPILFKGRHLSLGASLFCLAIAGGCGVIFYLVTKPSE